MATASTQESDCRNQASLSEEVKNDRRRNGRTLTVLGTVLIVQFSLQWAANYINRRSGLKAPVVTYRLSLGFNPASAEAVRKAWSSFVSEPGITVTSYGEARNDQVETVEASIGLAEDRANAAASLSQRFAEIPGVVHTHCKQMPGPKRE